MARWTTTAGEGMYVVIRIKPRTDDPARWDGRTKTIIGQKPTQAQAIDLACALARLPEADRRARYFVRKVGQEHTIAQTTPWPRAAMAVDTGRAA